MISGDPSSIPGLTEETRKILEERARRAGKPFDEWLNEMLAADRAAHGNAPEDRAPSGDRWTQERVSRLKERIEGLSSRGESRAENIEPRTQSRAADRVEPAPLTAPASEPSRSARRAPSADAPTLAMIADALKGLEAEAGRIAAREPIRPRTPVLDPEPLARRSTAADNSALRAAVAEIAARQEVIERARSTPAREAALIERVSELKGEIGGLAARLPAELGNKVTTLTETVREGLAAESRGHAMLKDQLTQLSRAVDAEHQGRRGEGEAIKTEIARIARLIEEDGAGGRAALASLVERLDEQRTAFEGLARESTLQSLEAGYRHVIGRLDELARAMPGNDEIKSLSSAVAHIGESLTRRGDKAETARIDAGFAELRTAIAQGKSSEKIEAALASLGAQIDKALAGLPRADLVESLLERLETVTDRLDAAPAAPAAIAGEIAGFKQAIGEFRTIAGRLDTAGNQAPLISRIDSRLEEMTRGLTKAFLDAQAKSQTKLEAEIKALASRIDAPRTGPGMAELREHLEDMTEGLAVAFNEAQAGAVQRLEEQIRSLTARLETQPAGTPGLDELKARLDAVHQSLAQSMADAPTGARETLETQIRALAERLDAQPAEAPGVQQLRERLDALSAELRQALAAQSGSDLRIESEMRALNQRVEAGRAEATAVAQLGERLEALAESLRDAFGRARDEGNEKLESEIRALAARIDGAEAEAQTVAQLEAEFRVLAARLEEPRTADGPTATDLDLQIRALRARVEASEANTPAISQLEARIRGLAERLERGAPAAEAIGSPTADSEESAALIEALTHDLHTIRAAAENADQRTSENLDSVQAALDGVVGRLSALEGAQRYRPTESELGAERESLTAAFADEPDSRAVARVEATDAAEAESEEKPSDRKADFIAAARRAAQAAAAESAAMRLKDAANKPGRNPLSRIAGIFKNRGRPLMLAAAAVVLTVGAVRFYPQIALHGESGDAEIVASAAMVPDVTGASVPEIATGLLAADAEATVPSVAPGPLPETGVVANARPVGPAGSESSLPEIDPSALAFAALELGAQAVAALPPVITQGFQPTALSTDRVPDRVPSSVPVVAATPAPAAPQAPPIAIPLSPGVDSTITAALPPAEPAAPAEAVDTMSGMNRLMAAANAGDPFAQFELADRFSDGRGVAVDLAQAASWYEKAANGGIAVAQYRIGSLYERGQGVAADREVALSWYEKAAAEGNVQAMHNLAVLVAEGVGGSADIATATQWFERAAESGVSDSQFNLGVIYARGLGRPQDLVQSYKWFALAANAGDGEAADRREVVAGMMTPDQLAQARAAVLAWRATPPLQTANAAPVPDPAWAISAEGTDLVRQVQALLGERGFNAGPADGVIGARTRDAVREYQRAAGLPVTGTIDSGLLASLTARTI